MISFHPTGIDEDHPFYVFAPPAPEGPVSKVEKSVLCGLPDALVVPVSEDLSSISKTSVRAPNWDGSASPHFGPLEATGDAAWWTGLFSSHFLDPSVACPITTAKFFDGTGKEHYDQYQACASLLNCRRDPSAEVVLPIWQTGPESDTRAIVRAQFITAVRIANVPLWAKAEEGAKVTVSVGDEISFIYGPMGAAIVSECVATQFAMNIRGVLEVKKKDQAIDPSDLHQLYLESMFVKQKFYNSESDLSEDVFAIESNSTRLILATIPAASTKMSFTCVHAEDPRVIRNVMASFLKSCTPRGGFPSRPRQPAISLFLGISEHSWRRSNSEDKSREKSEEKSGGKSGDRREKKRLRAGSTRAPQYVSGSQLRSFVVKAQQHDAWFRDTHLHLWGQVGSAPV